MNNVTPTTLSINIFRKTTKRRLTSFQLLQPPLIRSMLHWTLWCIRILSFLPLTSRTDWVRAVAS